MNEPGQRLQEAYRFSVPEDRLRAHQRALAQRFIGCRSVLDLGCGRGVVLDLLRERGIEAEGVDIMADAVAHCQAKGHRAQVAEANQFLADKLDRYDGILCSHVLEHLDFEDSVLLVSRCFRALRSGGLLLIVTPNSRDIAIMSDIFWLDPTHRRPYPPELVRSLLDSAGFREVKIEAPLGRPPRRREWPAWAFRKLLLGPYFGNPETIAAARKPAGAGP